MLCIWVHSRLVVAKKEGVLACMFEDNLFIFDYLILADSATLCRHCNILSIVHKRSLGIGKVMMTSRTALVLSNSLSMPSFGLGTWQQYDPATVKRVVRQALDAGYRLIDTASAYRNEPAIGSALAEAFKDSALGLRRKDVWITSKLAPKQQGFNGATAAVLGSLRDLQTDYIDLYLIHWPGVSGRQPEDAEHKAYRKESWRALENLYKQGKVRAIGVSNYTRTHLQEMMEYAQIMPMVNQCELHPLCPQTDLLRYCHSNDIAFTAYASFGEGVLLSSDVSFPQLDTVAARRLDLTRAQILLLWALQRDIAVIPKASSMSRLQENIGVFDKEPLSAQDISELSSVSPHLYNHYCWNPEHVA